MGSRPALLAGVVALAACSSAVIPARAVADADPSIRWSPRPRTVPVAKAPSGTYSGTVCLRERQLVVVVDPGGGGRAPTLVVPDVGDGTSATLTGTVDGGSFYVEGALALHPDGGTLHVRLAASGDGGAAPTLEVLVTECPVFEVDLGGRTFRGLLFDGDADGRFDDLDSTRVVFDRDGDGEHDDDDEGYDADAAFDLGTGAFRVRSVSADGLQVAFEPSWRSPRVRPFVGRGDVAPALPTETIDGGAPIDLSALHGRRVLLLFWFPA